MEIKGNIMKKCPMPDINKLWSRPMSENRKNNPIVAFSIAPTDPAPDVMYEMPKRFVKAPNGCVSTQYLRNRMYEVKFPWSSVVFRMTQNNWAEPEDMYKGMDIKATFDGPIRHYEEFPNYIVEQYPAWVNTDKPVLQVSLPIMLFTDDPEVWVDVIPSDRTKQNLPITLIPGFMPIYGWSRGLSWAFEWTNTDVKEFKLNDNVIMFNLLFSKPVNLEYREWNDDFQNQWDKILNIGHYRNNTNTLYPEALMRRVKKLIPKK